MKRTDPFELFKHLEPSFDADDITQRNADILTAVRAHAERAGTPRNLRPWLLGGGAVAIVLATAAFAVLRTAPVSDPTATLCLATTSVDGDVVGLAASEDPVASCRQLWIDGTLGDGEVPPLTACVNAAGAASVVPAGGAICNRLGLEELEPGLDSEQQAVVDVSDALIDLFLADCFDEAAAVEAARRQLDAAGLVDWTVDVAEPFDAALPCAGPGVDADNRRIFVIGVRDR